MTVWPSAWLRPKDRGLPAATGRVEFVFATEWTGKNSSNNNGRYWRRLPMRSGKPHTTRHFPTLLQAPGSASREPTIWLSADDVKDDVTSDAAFIGAFGAATAVAAKEHDGPFGLGASRPRGPGRMKESKKGVAHWLLPS